MSQFDTLSDIKSETTYHNYNHTNLYEPDISLNAEPYSARVSIASVWWIGHGQVGGQVCGQVEYHSNRLVKTILLNLILRRWNYVRASYRRFSSKI